MKATPQPRTKAAGTSALASFNLSSPCPRKNRIARTIATGHKKSGPQRDGYSPESPRQAQQERISQPVPPQKTRQRPNHQSSAYCSYSASPVAVHPVAHATYTSKREQTASNAQRAGNQPCSAHATAAHIAPALSNTPIHGFPSNWPAPVPCLARADKSRHRWDIRVHERSPDKPHRVRGVRQSSMSKRVARQQITVFIVHALESARDPPAATLIGRPRKLVQRLR